MGQQNWRTNLQCNNNKLCYYVGTSFQNLAPFFLLFCSQAYRELLESERLLPENTDVRAYQVDGVNYLARTD